MLRTKTRPAPVRGQVLYKLTGLVCERYGLTFCEPVCDAVADDNEDSVVVHVRERYGCGGSCYADCTSPWVGA